MTYSEKTVQQAWEKARAIPDKDPTTWRKDECGAWIKRGHYGNGKSEFGWRIENVSSGDPDTPENLRPLHWQNYVQRGVGQATCRVKAEPEGMVNSGA